MRNYFIWKKVSLFSIAICTIITLSAWQKNGSASSSPVKKDTTPVKLKNIKDFDEALQELDKGMMNLEKDLQKPIPPIPPIDMAKMKAEIENSLKQIDVDKMKMELDASLAKVDFEKIKMELQKVKDIELPKMQANLQKIGPDIQKSLQNAKQSIEKAKTELQQYKTFVDALDKDGLLDKSKPYTIEIKDDKLTINGKEQTAEVANKYKSFLSAHNNLTIKKNSDGLNITKD